MHPASASATALTGPITTPGAALVPAEPEPPPKLSPREWAFVEAKLLGHSNPKAGEIARIPGASYDARRIKAAKLMRDPRIQRALAYREQEILDELRVNKRHVKEELAVNAFSDISHYTIDDNGYVGLAEGAPAHAMRAISGIKRKVRYIRQQDGPPIKQVETEFKLWDKGKALETLGKTLEMFRDDGGPGGGLVVIFDMTGGRPHAISP